MSLLHAKTRLVDRDEVMNVPEPQWTSTWHPVSHNGVLFAVDQAIKTTGLELVSEQYSMSENGMNMFGMWTLDQGSRGRQWALGIRNSMQKHFSLGICAGFNVMVCDNIMMSGDYITFRKHTGGLYLAEVIQLARGAMGQMVDRMYRIERWHDKLADYPLSDVDFKAMTFDAMRNGVFAPSKFKAFLDGWQLESKISEGANLQAFHGAVTRLNRGRNLHTQAENCSTLETMINAAVKRNIMMRKFK